MTQDSIFLSEASNHGFEINLYSYDKWGFSVNNSHKHQKLSQSIWQILLELFSCVIKEKAWNKYRQVLGKENLFLTYENSLKLLINSL
jgi:hypothetical protein